MALPETFTQFARTAAEQLRWKAARPLVEDELLTHLCDQRDALMAGGMDEAAAAAESLRLTGDPYEIGTALDRVHRPKTPKLLFALAALIALAGLAFTALVSFRDWSCQEWFSPKMQGSPGATWLHQAAGVWCAL